MKFFREYKGYIFLLLIVLLALKVIIPQLDDLRESLAALKEANLYWVGLGIIIFYASMPFLAYQYFVLALKPLSYLLTLQVEMAGLFVSKLLPSSLGTISLNMYYLINQKHTPSEGTAVLTMNAISSATAFSILIILALTGSDLALGGLNQAVDLPVNLILFLIILLAGAIYFALRSDKLKAKAKKSIADLKKNFTSYKRHPRILTSAIACNFIGSLSNLIILYLSAKAIGVDLSLAGAMLAYTFGNIAATLVPTPGGIGSTEAGLYSGLVLFGIDGPQAMIVVLIYRLITYWIPILPGYYFFWRIRKNVLSKFSLKKRYV